MTSWGRKAQKSGAGTGNIQDLVPAEDNLDPTREKWPTDIDLTRSRNPDTRSEIQCTRYSHSCQGLVFICDLKFRSAECAKHCETTQAGNQCLHERSIGVVVLASRHLPMPQKRVRRDREYVHLFALSRPEVASLLDLPQAGDLYEQATAHPTRTLANGLINACWRNGPVEDIHAGMWGTYPLLQRRATVREEQTLMRATAERLAQGLYGLSLPEDNTDLRSCPDRVLPYAFAHQLLVTPSGWSLEEESREVWLPGPEP